MLGIYTDIPAEGKKTHTHDGDKEVYSYCLPLAIEQISKSELTAEKGSDFLLQY